MSLNSFFLDREKRTAKDSKGPHLPTHMVSAKKVKSVKHGI